MTDLERYAELEQRRKILTDLAFEQKAKIAKLKEKKKIKEAQAMEKEYEKNLIELKAVMTELPLAEAAAERESIIIKATTPADVKPQQDNEIIYTSGEYALVLCTDGTIAYTVQPEGTVTVGDMAFEADLKDFILLPEEKQNELISGYRAARRNG